MSGRHANEDQGDGNPRPVRRARRRGPQARQPPPEREPDDEGGVNPMHQPEILQQVVVFLDAPALHIWERVSRSFRQASQDTKQWGRLANKRFGVSQSMDKDGWRLGIALMKDPISFQFEDHGDFGAGHEFIAGSPSLGLSSSVVAVSSDDMDMSRDFETTPSFPQEGHNGIILRDVQTLNYIRTLSSPICNWGVVFCGKEGCEIMLTWNGHRLCARRGQQIEMVNVRTFLPEEESEIDCTFPGTDYVLGCESYVVTVMFGKVFLFEVDLPDGALIRFKESAPIYEEPCEEPLTITPQCLSRSEEDTSTFVFAEPNQNNICIWKLNVEEGNVQAQSCFDVAPILIQDGAMGIRTTALSENFVAGASKDKKLHVWNRHSGLLVHQDLRDVEIDEDEWDEDYLLSLFIYPLVLQVVSGDLLVSSSTMGSHLCVWNLRSGSLLARHSPSRTVDDPPEGSDMSSLVQLPTLKYVFLSAANGLDVWGFPTEDISRKRIESIARRERQIGRMRRGGGGGFDAHYGYDSDWS